MRITTRLLPVALTESERLAIGESVEAKATEIEIVEADKRAAVAKHNSALKELRGELSRLRTNFRNHSEEREVECREEPGEGGTIRVIRLDTGEFVGDVREEGADGDERQLGLPIIRPGKACEGCGNADGTHHPSCFVGQVNGGIVDPSDGDDDGDAPDYSEAAEIAAEQVASGEKPETGTPAKKPRKSRKGAEASA